MNNLNNRLFYLCFFIYTWPTFTSSVCVYIRRRTSRHFLTFIDLKRVNCFFFLNPSCYKYNFKTVEEKKINNKEFTNENHEQSVGEEAKPP